MTTMPEDTVTPVPHQCFWLAVGAQSRSVLLGIGQTDVLMRCNGCGDVRTETLNGTWSLDQVRGQAGR